MKQSDFTFSKDPDDKDTILMVLRIHQVCKMNGSWFFWRMTLKKAIISMMGICLAAIVQYDTNKYSAVRSFIHFNYWLNNISDPISKSSINFTYDEAWKVVRKFGLIKRRLMTSIFQKVINRENYHKH